jgi:ADP-ribosylglycohydrolase
MILRDKIKGTLYGQAIGDALGVAVEFRSAAGVRQKYGDDNAIGYEKVQRTTCTWEAGEFTDDPEQALCILDAFIADGGELKPTTLAEKFVDWAETNGRGMGNHTWNVLSTPMYTLDPLAVSKDIWERSGKKAAANGAVMRTSAVALLARNDLNQTEALASLAAMVTHFDPRCVASAVAISTALAALIDGSHPHAALNIGILRGRAIHEDVAKYAAMSLDELALDEGLRGVGYTKGAPIGYTFKCMGAGFWALRQPGGFREVLEQVIRAGGDTDTNGAVAGAMLGAFQGFHNLPADLVEGLYDREALDSRLRALETL